MLIGVLIQVFRGEAFGGAKSFLIEGLGWRVGKGDSIHIKGDRWLMSDGKFVAPNLLDDNIDDFLAWNLIDHDSRQRKIDTLHVVFDSTTVANILTIPISPNEVVDRLFWALSKEENYSVKTGYWLGMGGFSRQVQQGGEVWMKIWNQKWPPKLKHFI